MQQTLHLKRGIRIEARLSNSRFPDENSLTRNGNCVKRYTILHCIETGGPGGAETVFLNLVVGLNKDRFRSIVLVPEDRWLNKALKNAGVEAILQDPGYPLKQMTGLIRKEKVDLIQSHLPDQNFYSCLVGLWTGKKTVVTYHGAFDASPKSAMKLWVVRRCATVSVGVSQFLKESMVSLRFPEQRLRHIYNGVHLEKFLSPAGQSLRAELKLLPDTKLVGMVANIRSSKGYEYFVKAAHNLIERNANVRFLAIGEIDRKLGAELRVQIAELGLAPFFLLLGFRDDVPSLLQQLDVFVLASTSEGFSLATVEAMAAARAVVVTRSGGPQEIVEDGRTGLMVPPGDPEALADGICQLLNDRDRAMKMGQQARTEVERKFSMQKMITDYENLYLTCIESDEK